LLFLYLGQRLLIVVVNVFWTICRSKPTDWLIRERHRRSMVVERKDIERKESNVC